MTIQQIAGCCDCATGTHPCIVSICPNVQPFDVIVCDDCGEETDVYEFDGSELCFDCIWESLPKSNDAFCPQCGEYEETRLFFGESLCAACLEEKLQAVGCHSDI